MSREKYFGAEKAAEVCSIWRDSAASQMGKMVEQCDLTNRILSTDGRIAGGAPLATRAGFVAEELHSETFNFDAILKGKNARAFTDRYQNSPLRTNDPTNDIVIMRDGEQVQGVQLKYYKDGKRTANAFRDTRDGIAHYEKTDTMLGPSDQLSDIKEAARKTELKNQDTRPEVVRASRQVQEKTTDRIKQDGAESRPLTKKEAEQIAKGGESGKGAHRKIQNHYKNTSTVQQTIKAAGSAAVVTSVVAGTINTINCLSKVQKGEMTTDEAVGYILKNTAIAAADSALKAGAATAAVSTAVRVMPDFFVKTSTLQGSLRTGLVAGSAICAIDTVQCLVMVAAGRMTSREMEERIGKNVFQTGAGVVGSSIGATIGAVGGPVGSVIGAIVGGMITSVAVTFAIENHIEKSYRETLANAESLARVEGYVAQSLAYLATSAEQFAIFKSDLKKSEQDFSCALSTIRAKRDANWARILAMK